MNKQIIVAIDGYSGCGKSTIAKDVAKTLKYVFIDTGAMYRGVTLYAMNNNMIINGDIKLDILLAELDKIKLHFQVHPVTEKQELYLNGINVEEEIRTPEVAAMVSKVARIIPIRRKLVEEQRAMGALGGIVMDGRDIASVVFPNADIKFFVTADPKIRAERRLAEMKSKGIETTLDAVLENLLERDQIDTTREEGPLIQTPDAILIDTSNHTRASQLDLVLHLIQEKMK